MSESAADGLFSISAVASAFGMAVSALRYYDDIGLVAATERRGAVRWYDRDALRQLAYVQLWHDDGMLSLADTRAIVDRDRLGDRLDMIAGHRDTLRDQAARILRAAAVLDHMLGCRTDRPLECPYTGGYIDACVDHALFGVALGDDFLPASAAVALTSPTHATP
jgi:MerR family transcriptional regulator, redox-sensitive transcriptional activator SoxR